MGRKKAVLGRKWGFPNPVWLPDTNVSVEGTGQRLTELGSCPCSATDRP